MIFQIYGRAYQALMKQPIRLIGLSLFGSLVTGLASVLFSVPLGLGIALGLLFNVAMAQIFLRSYRGETCNTQDLFATYRDRDLLKRALGGMAWRELWLFIWCLIPVVGPIFAIVKSYTYALTPYILMNEDEVKPMDAIKVSKKRTEGYRGKIFWADVLIFVGVWLVSALLSLLVRIPYIGVLFGIVLVVFSVVCAALLPLFLGLVHAAFYDEILNPTIPLVAPATQPQQPVYQQPVYPQQPQQPVYQQPQQPQQPQGWVVPAAPVAPAQPEVQPVYRFCTACGTRYDVNQTQVCPNCGRPMN